MSVERVSAAGDARVDEYAALRDDRSLRERGLFVAEGRLVVRRVVESRRFEVRSVLLNQAALAELESALARLPPHVPVLLCDTADFVRITGFNIHRGCLALVHRPPALAVADVVRGARRVVALDEVTNADNVGGIFRNAAAFSVDGVLLSPTGCDPLYRKAIRTSMGAALQIPFARVVDEEWPQIVARLRDEGFAVAALTPRSPAIDLDAFVAKGSLPERLAVVVGAEGRGLSEAIEAAADVRLRIRISDRVDSLNAAVAAGIALQRLNG
jgi:tRNA G18 (ribose-2'-O)-methylase SpoU